MYIGKPMSHIEKYLLVNRMLSGQANLIPFFNEQNNEDLLISIQTAGVYNGGKDKRGEKLAETEEDRPMVPMRLIPCVSVVRNFHIPISTCLLLPRCRGNYLYLCQ